MVEQASIPNYQQRPESQDSRRPYSEYGTRQRQRPLSQYNESRLMQRQLQNSNSAAVNQTMVNFNPNPLDITVLSDNNQVNMSTNDIAKSQQWGVEGYYCPTNDWYFHKPKTFWAKGKKENIIEYQARKKKEMPAPNHYKLDNDWSKSQKGKFLKGPRTTEIDSILSQKKLKLPGPGQYKTAGHKIQNIPKTTSDKCQFINDAKFTGMQTPGWKYKINYDSVRPKTPAARYFQVKQKTPASVSIKPKKTKDPDPGSYNIEECYRKTQWVNSVYMISKANNKNFIDNAVKAKTFVPGIGKYKEIEKGYQALSKPPISLRRMR